jgi:aldose 1-epimerase
MQFIDDAEFQIAIDDDNGARITSLKWLPGPDALKRV